RVRAPAGAVAARLGAVCAGRAPARRQGRLARMARGRGLPRPEHPRVLARPSARPLARALARGRDRGRPCPPPQPRGRHRGLGAEGVTDDARPAFYALAPGGWRDYVTLLHPPYTLWHLSYVAIGAGLAPYLDFRVLGLALAAFFLALGIGAHALDELKGRPLRTRIGSGTLVALAVASIGGAIGIGVAVSVMRDLWLLAFVACGGFLVVAYNLELFGGRFHGDWWFAASWGGFPTLTGY